MEGGGEQLGSVDRLLFITLGIFQKGLSYLLLSCFRVMDPKGLALNVFSWETIDKFSRMLTGMDIPDFRS